MKENLKKYWFILFLLSIDLTLIILHLINFWIPFDSRNAFYMEGNNSYAEYFQNLKWVGMIFLSLLIVGKTKDRSYYSWALLFVFLFLEDVFRIHQVVTSLISQNILGGITTVQWKILEVTIVIIIGLIFLIPFIKNYHKGKRVFRLRSRTVIWLLILLAFFGIAMDQIHRLDFVRFNWKLKFVAGLIEDGGEMVTASCLLGYLAFIYFDNCEIYKKRSSTSL